VSYSLAVLGVNNINLPKIVQIIAEAFALDALPPSSEVKQRMINIVKQVEVCKTNMFQSII